MASSPKLITLSPPGEREVVDEDRAKEFLIEWEQQLVENDNVVVQKVVLSNKSYLEDAAALVAQWLEQHCATVTILDASDIIAGRPEEEGLAVLKLICDAFQNANLVEVNLSDNAMGSKGIKACESVLDAQQDSLQRLYLENMGLSAESMGEVADILTLETNGVCVCDNLKVLSCYNNMSGDAGGEAVKRVLARCKHLEVLRYSGCRALRVGSKALGEGLEAMGDNICTLTRLDLSGSHFGNEEGDGITNLASALSRATNLKYAILKDYGLHAEGTAMVVKALQQSGAPLVELDIAENEIGPEGAKSLAPLLQDVVGTLQVFKAEENELTSLGIKRIVEGLSSDTSILQELRLDNNECGPIGAKALCNATFPKLEVLHVNENFFPAPDVAKLEAVFGGKLQEMEDNDEDEDVDADLEEEEGEEEKGDIGGLEEQLSKVQI